MIFFIIGLIILLLLLCLSVYFNYKFARIIFNVEDQVEESLDILDECYGRIARIAQTEVASDDPFVKDVVVTVRKARDAVLLVANKLVAFASDNDSNEKKDKTS